MKITGTVCAKNIPKGELLRYARFVNPHLLLVNCGFSGVASLEFNLFIHFHINEK